MLSINVRVSVDTRGLKRLQANLKKLTPEVRREWNEAAVKELAARLLQKVSERTPTGKYLTGSGKVGGTLKRGWTVGEVTKTGDTYSIEVFNPVEYALYVEYGHRTRDHKGWVEGQFMLTIAIQELMADNERILENRLTKLLSQYL